MAFALIKAIFQTKSGSRVYLRTSIREITFMNTYAGGALTSAEAATLAAQIIRGRTAGTNCLRPARSDIFHYHLYQLNLAFKYTKGNSPACRAAESLLQSVIKNCNLLETVDHRKWNAIAFLLRLCRYHKHWITSPSSWSPKDVSELPHCSPKNTALCNNSDLFHKLRSLVRHLLGQYHLAGFWDSVWFQSKEINFQWMDWYVDLSAGKSFQSLVRLPIKLSKKASHLLNTKTPDNLPLPKALRWAQLRAEGIPEDVCKIVTNHRCSTDFENDHLWLPLFRLFKPSLEAREILELCTYTFLRKHKRNDGDSYQIKGKTLPSLTREMRGFHQSHPEYIIQPIISQRRTKRRCKVLNWQHHSDYKDWFEYDINNDITYSIEEICKSFQLISEGRKMNHCVGSYISRCLNGESSIWSLRFYSNGKRKAHVTIELDPRRQMVVQAKSYQNTQPSKADWQRIHKWAQLNKISFASWL